MEACNNSCTTLLQGITKIGTRGPQNNHRKPLHDLTSHNARPQEITLSFSFHFIIIMIISYFAIFSKNSYYKKMKWNLQANKKKGGKPPHALARLEEQEGMPQHQHHCPQFHHFIFHNFTISRPSTR
jgi:hypothetical protein